MLGRAMLVALTAQSPLVPTGRPQAPWGSRLHARWGLSTDSRRLPEHSRAGARSHAPGARELWATINRCEPPREPHTIGVRGSMPGDGAPGDAMYMRFRLQYLNPRTRHWAYVGGRADSGFVHVGGASVTLQAGRTFTLKPASKPVHVRGVVSFQWRRGARVLRSAEKVTVGGHVSDGGADPPRFSAATCLLRSGPALRAKTPPLRGSAASRRRR